MENPSASQFYYILSRGEEKVYERKLKIRKESRTISGEERTPTTDKETMNRVAKLPPDQKKALLEALKEETA